jgi:F0F1-type ATP synthase assembly protein I
MIDSRERRERRHLNQGFGRALSNAFEIAVVPAIFLAIGWGVDHLVGTHLVFAIVLGLVGLAGTVVKMYYAYSYEMAQHAEAGAWNRAPRVAPTEPTDR